MTRRVVMAALVACLAGCMGDSTSVPTSALSQIVLQPADVSGVFERFDEGRLALADQPEGRRAQPDRFGRDDGWKARYRRRGGAEVRGPLVIESRVDRFESSGGAEKELDAIAGEVAADVGDRGLGDEALVASSTQAGFPRKLRNVMVAWRSVNIVAVVTLSGFQGRLRDADALRLARLQQARIDAATG